MEDEPRSESPGSSENLANVEEIPSPETSPVQEQQELDTSTKDLGVKVPQPGGVQKPEEVAKDDTLSQRTEDTLDDVSSKSKSDLLEEEEEVRKEEERRKRMKVLLTGYLELKTKKETERAILNEKKITDQWLYPFRGAYQKEWELDMRKLKLSFQRALDYKKSHIHAIQRERKLAELNHLWADSAHQRIVEELFDFMRARCESLKVEYLKELKDTKNYYLEKERQLVDRFSKTEERAKVLGILRKTVREKTLQKTREALLSYKHQGEFLKTREMEAVRQKHASYVEAIARELQSSVSPPEHKMDEVRALFDQWKGKYEDFLEVSEKNRKELAKFGEDLPALEAKVATARKTLEDLRAENKEEKRRQAEEIRRLQDKARKCDLIGPSMRKMVSESESVLVKLRERKDKLEKIIKLQKMCDQMETGSDKILPRDNLLDEDEQKQIDDSDHRNLVADFSSEVPEDPDLLRNLHRKMARVQLQNQYLQHDIENLRIEGRALRCDMKKYLTLIASGEWQRIPDDKLREFGHKEGQNSPEGVQNSHEEGQKSTQEGSVVKGVERNLQLLDRKFGKVNEEVIKRAENM